jgi:choline-sulfatase
MVSTPPPTPPPAAFRDDGFHYGLDLAPTLLDLLGAKNPDLWDGTSFAGTVRSGRDEGREDLVLSQCAHVCQRSARWGRWLYLRTYHDGFHLFPREMLFDLESDPHEQNNLAEAMPEICREGMWRLARWHDAQMEKMALSFDDCSDPLWTIIREGGPFHASLRADFGEPGGRKGFERYLRRLETTGRREGAEQLRKKYGNR